MKVEKFKIDGWKEKITGLIVSEDEEWVLIKNIPNEYILDGFKLIRKKFIKKRKTGKNEKLIKRVLTLRKIEISGPFNLKFGNVIEILKSNEEKYGFFEFQDHSDSELFYGKIKEIKKDKLIIDFINKFGKIDCNFDYEFELDGIRCIAFESNYFNSIKLLYEDELSMK